MTESEEYHVAFPALLRAARLTYRDAVRASLADAGFEDMPGNGSYVVGAVARVGAPLAQIIGELGVSKQTAGQLVDTLVARGYLDRTVDPDDRRRLTVSLTERGEAAAAAIRAAVEEVDAAVEARVGAESLRQARIALGGLFELGAERRARTAASGR